MMSWLTRCQACRVLATRHILNQTAHSSPTKSAEKYLGSMSFLHTSCARYPRGTLYSGSQPPSDQTSDSTTEQKATSPDPDRSKPEKQKYRTKTRLHSIIDPNDTTMLLFPGQGSQFVGMGRNLLEYPGIEEMYSQASNILGYDLLDVCLNGPVEKLNETVHCQPAVMVTSLAAMEALKYTTPWAIEHCITACGFSVGEYAALVFAGAMSFQDAVRLIKVRAEAMQEASLTTPSGMMTVYIGHKTKLKFACHTAKRYCTEDLKMERPVCDVANYLFPECKVIAGHKEALEFLERHGREFGIARMKRLPVSGAFHTQVMYPVKRVIEEALEDVDMKLPIVPVHSNVTGQRYRNVDKMKTVLAEQVFKPVKWEQIMHIIYSRPDGTEFPFTYEFGPGKQLGALLKRVNSKTHSKYTAVPV